MRVKRIDIYKTEKSVRALVIKAYMERQHIHYAVCFSCGNASAYLREIGVPLLDVSPHGDMTANRWFTVEEVRGFFPLAFDATSGHLPIHIMRRIADGLKEALCGEFETDTEYEVLSGSGETVLCLKMAFPDILFTPVYDDRDEATKFCEEAPLNPLIISMFKKIVRLC